MSASRVVFLCTGNICRSPMGEVILRALAARAGHEDRIAVSSRGTQGWHEGKPADPRTVAALAAAGYRGEAHIARQITDQDLAEADLIVALDRGHEAFLLAAGVEPERIVLLSVFDPAAPEDPDVFDPYYSDEDAFRRVLTQIEQSCDALLAELTTGASPASTPATTSGGQ